MRTVVRGVARALETAITAEERAADEAERLIVRIDRLGAPFRSEGVRAVVRRHRVEALKLRGRLAAHIETDSPSRTRR